MKELSIEQVHVVGVGNVYDFHVSGRCLLRKIRSFGYDLLPSIQSGGWLDVEKRDMLLLHTPGDTPTGRVALYTCPCCGDLGCGAVSARVERHHDQVLWKDFVYEVSYEEEPVETLRLGPFAFNADAYMATLKAYLA